MGADETIMKLKGEKAVVGFVMDAESGRLVGIDLLVERDKILRMQNIEAGKVL